MFWVVVCLLLLDFGLMFVVYDLGCVDLLVLLCVVFFWLVE